VASQNRKFGRADRGMVAGHLVSRRLCYFSEDGAWGDSPERTQQPMRHTFYLLYDAVGRGNMKKKFPSQRIYIKL
jgi:hypothetical protein